MYVEVWVYDIYFNLLGKIGLSEPELVVSSTLHVESLSSTALMPN